MSAFVSSTLVLFAVVFAAAAVAVATPESRFVDFIISSSSSIFAFMLLFPVAKSCDATIL